MLVRGDRYARRRPLYNQTAALRLSRLRRRLALAVALLTALSAAGCSSIPLGSLFSKQDADADTTGSISRPAVAQADHPEAAGISGADLAYARAAAASALTRGTKANSVPWRNPQTGVGGNITPLAASYSQNGLPCREFLASYVSGASQAWLQGSACRTTRGAWEVKSLKPFKSG